MIQGVNRQFSSNYDMKTRQNPDIKQRMNPDIKTRIISDQLNFTSKEFFDKELGVEPKDKAEKPKSSMLENLKTGISEFFGKIGKLFSSHKKEDVKTDSKPAEKA